jgi:hypothetical protein
LTPVIVGRVTNNDYLSDVWAEWPNRTIFRTCERLRQRRQLYLDTWG